MLSALRTRKFTALFACFDFDKNGLLEQRDYEQFARNLSQAYNLAPGTAAGSHETGASSSDNVPRVPSTRARAPWGSVSFLGMWPYATWLSTGRA